MRQQHRKLHARTSWAELDREDDPLGLKGDAAALLRRAGGLVAADTALPKGLLELTRLRDANVAGPSEGVVRACRFHPHGRLLLTAGLDKRIRLFQVRVRAEP